MIWASIFTLGKIFYIPIMKDWEWLPTVFSAECIVKLLDFCQFYGKKYQFSCNFHLVWAYFHMVKDYMNFLFYELFVYDFNSFLWVICHISIFKSYLYIKELNSFWDINDKFSMLFVIHLSTLLMACFTVYVHIYLFVIILSVCLQIKYRLYIS